ncbi:MAG: hypothetical protein ABJG15_17760 [Hyphomonadaceae bacterium]
MEGGIFQTVKLLAMTGVLSILACVCVSPAAHASVTSNPHFKIDGLVIVWGANGSSTGQIGRTVQTKADAQTPVFAPVHVLTGQLDTLAQPDLVALDHREQHFYVASNTGFSIDAELTGHSDLTAPDLRNTEFDLSVSLGDNGSDAFGRHAQYPHQGGARGGMNTDIRTLADLTTRKRVFTGTQRTAADSGSIAEQSVRFDMRLTRTADYAPSTAASSGIDSQIVFTVFAP